MVVEVGGMRVGLGAKTITKCGTSRSGWVGGGM